MEEFTLINKQRNRIKVFKPFEDISKPFPSINIADDLFVLLIRGNGLNPNSMFDNQNLIKESIRWETLERVAKCKEWKKEAVPKNVLEKLANQQLKNLLMKQQRYSGFGGLELLSRLNKVNEYVIFIHQIYFWCG